MLSLSALAGSGTATAAAAPQRDSIVACVDKGIGRPAHHQAAPGVRSRGMKIKWRIRGVRGPRGAIGPQGPAGATGPRGA